MSSKREAGENEAGGMYGRLMLVAVILIAAWLLWSGLYKPLLLALGAFSCALTVVIAKRMGFFDTDVFFFRYNLKLFGFWAWLGREIIKSSLEVARIVLAPKLRIDPQVIEVDASDLEPVDQALLGNSITLTPGTLTLDVHEGRLLVHALTSESAASVLGGEMKRRVAALHRD
jgi:multicomponent Na+:H+ antiporter subunit E